MNSKLKGYLWGWLLSYVAVIFFAAIKMMEVSGPFGEVNHLVTPLFVSLIVWTMIFLLSTMFKVMLVAVAALTFFMLGLGAILVIPIWAYIGFVLADFILPAEWLVLESTEWMSMLGMGFVFLVIDLIVDRDIKFRARAQVRRNS